MNNKLAPLVLLAGPLYGQAHAATGDSTADGGHGDCAVVAHVDKDFASTRDWQTTAAGDVEEAGGDPVDACVVVDGTSEGGVLTKTRKGWSFEVVAFEYDITVPEDPETEQLVLTIGTDGWAKNANNGEGWQYSDRFGGK